MNLNFQIFFSSISKCEFSRNFSSLLGFHLKSLRGTSSLCLDFSFKNYFASSFKIFDFTFTSRAGINDKKNSLDTKKLTGEP